MTAGIAAEAPPPVPRRHIAAVVVGNALGFYDFVAYAFFAAQIGRAFFPSSDPGLSLLASLATFGVGFLTRPLGAIVIGRMGDRVGRKPAMLVSFALLGTGVVGLALTPAYAEIGIAAPLLAIGFRLLQGFALGGEVGPSTAFLIEAAPPARRGFFVSLQYASADTAVLAAGLIGVALSSALTVAELDQWGWRAAFLAGAAILPAGLWLRRSLPETLGQPPHPGEAPPGRYARVAVLGGVMLAAQTTVSYLLNYLTTYAQSSLGMPATLAFGASVVVGLCGLVFAPVGGWLSDRFGRKPAMLVPGLLLLAAVFPAFAALSANRTGAVLYLVTAVLAIATTLSATATLVAVTEALPRRVRSGALAIVYALAISVFGGSTQFVVTWLIRVTGDVLAPAWYMAGAVLCGLAAMLATRETAPVRRRL